MRKLLFKWIERMQERIRNAEDDPRDWEKIKKELNKRLEEK